MKFLNWNKIVGWLTVLLVSGCVEPYAPEVIEAPNAYLVVNGFINANGYTTITLQRTQNLSDDAPSPRVTGAVVIVEGENGESYRLEPGFGIGGNYSRYLSLNPSQKYRLFIRTQEGKEYASDYVEVKVTPAIEEVSWEPRDGNVSVYINSKDPNNNTWYYRWEYEYAWQFRAAFDTILKYENGEIKDRTDADPDIYICWKSNKARTIELGTSKRLTNDVINKYELMSIPHTAEEVSVKLGVKVKQYALTREAYDYWETLKKNTENIGTLYDPLPSQLTSNIKSLSNPGEIVVGYITASTVTEKTGFVSVYDFPKEWRSFSPQCEQEEMLLREKSLAEVFDSGFFLPVNEIYSAGSPTPVGYTYAKKACVDCRVTGTNVKPDFWE